MVGYIIRRIFMLLPQLFVVSILVFLLMYMTPGDPAVLLLGHDMTEEALVDVRKELGLDKPLYRQYLSFIGGALKGDFGRSFQTRREVSIELWRTFPNTLILTCASMLISVVIGVPIGILTAYRQYSWIDNLFRFVTISSVSIPIYFLGLLLIYVFSIYLRILPSFGYEGFGHLILPSISLSAYSLGIIARMTRSSMLEVLKQAYIVTARSKGLAESLVVYGHAFRNALIPVVTVVGLQFGLLLGGAVLTETVFAWPGIGRLMITGVFARDYPMVRGCVLLVATAFIFVNLIVDILYLYLDPRIRYE
jgi:peptide/nickel transport system permease protein